MTLPTTPTADPSHASPLGKATEYQSHYAPELLYPIPRQLKRSELGLTDAALPFVGEDLWNAYELSWLNTKGKPVVAIGTFRVPADSPNLIESKSFKLYLNSFNQSSFDSIETVGMTMARDLSAAAGGAVEVVLESLSASPQASIGIPNGTLLDELDITCDRYQPAPELLTTLPGQIIEETLYSHLLKSNCLVTGQPDWAMLVIRYRGSPIDRAGLLRYIVSFRNHNEFHEQCVERIFTDIKQHCQPEALAVHARYTRRGGLDINPFRSTGDYAPPDNTREIRQ
ncbi:NADPH-dependent 7-cyano-7-deazaguanine reductase QueF [Ferribacterium limneticum]|uniref:NADPH-dependent 7-cyano-7-deazaguanine reductase QueF n=1 Tax=Ferribacterium limneticum TaxID=76259 RepID=UPI001CFA76D8|nr:NADPH-dependent 7-cyano-7-deazaguanine reductase QueF [Ferribacterium limneticum]UCV30334.1 NADPH-dependent 7-cyano-7-deazaguanine reductase QueF [Ferribacterium limneticum]UCV34252.1 NADPH-dependent 7-cyano-7-deazaguanine reductase QueF [Ferribacterium limneticum]